jgi:hypothetical protein
LSLLAAYVITVTLFNRAPAVLWRENKGMGKEQQKKEKGRNL